MSFDLSRIRFDARKDFLGVIMQQGRVQLDADWNEWVAQLAHRLQAGTLDTLNGSVVPRITPDGFRIEATGGGLTIGPGRIYVDGILAENHGGTPDAWDPQLTELTGTALLDYAAQPYYPNPPALPTGGPHLVYLDVWQRDITALQDPSLIEQAVGVDTTGRRQTVWQVKVLPAVGDIDCATAGADIPGWVNESAPSAARLSTATSAPTTDTDPCQVPPGAGYRGLENQLYRIEVHTGGVVGIATFKWSRDNGTVASRVTHINTARDTITVESTKRDNVLRFNNGDWVEVTDDWLELHNLPGHLCRIRLGDGVDDELRTLTLDSPLPAGLFPTDAQQATDATRNTRVRRWDQSGQVRDESDASVQDLDDPTSSGEIVIPATGTRLFLEHGILVEFDLDPAGGEFRSGDHWVFAARATDASIEMLDQAPPLGIHHHYAKLAVVEFPDAETDCRTLWPPLPEGSGCDCTVCVTAERHNDGTQTLQQAIDSIKGTGGTICLGIGSYVIGRPVNLDGARSLRIRGQGWNTLLIANEPGGILDIAGATGVALENLTVIGTASGAGTTSMIAARNVIDMQIEHVNILGLSVNDGTSVGIGLTGYALGVHISESAIVAERGVSALSSGERVHLLSGELRIIHNLFFCSQRAVSLHDLSLHYGNTAIENNLMLIGNQVAINATGATLSGSPMRIADNVIYTAAEGIRAGVDCLTIEGNEITGYGRNSGDGVILQEGVDPVSIEHVRISDNRLLTLQGNGIAITSAIETIDITNNVMQRLGLGALVMFGDGAAGILRFVGNQCNDLGTAVNDEPGFAAVQLIHVQRGDLLDNLIARVAMDNAAITASAVYGVRTAAVAELRVSGNRLFGIGPARGAEMAAICVLPPFADAHFSENHIERVADLQQTVNLAEWRAIDLRPESIPSRRYRAAASYIAADSVAYLLTASRAISMVARQSDVSIRGNHLRGQSTRVPLTQGVSMHHCLFAENHCEVSGETGKEPLLGQLEAGTLNVSNNRLIGVSRLETLHLRPEIDNAIVMGNTSTGMIRVLSGAPLPNDISLTNIIGA